MTQRPRIALTPGDPAGIGGELAAKLLASDDLTEHADVFVIASREEIDRAAEQAGVRLDVADEGEARQPEAQRPMLITPKRTGSLPDQVGEVSAAAGTWALDALRTALDLVAEDKVDAICFTPLNKSSLHEAGMHENDELRWFAKTLGFDGPTSELNVLDPLWTARVTSHISLAEVAARITREAVASTILMLDGVLRDAGVASPRIGVAALNPHAGERGRFGRQEIEEITPGIELAREKGARPDGPFPSDTIFLRARSGQFDGVVTMYHDQGQIAMKMMGFDKGVTVQGGLPIPITTPAHGTAFDIAGTRSANVGATMNAFRLAVTLAAQKKRGDEDS